MRSTLTGGLDRSELERRAGEYRRQGREARRAWSRGPERHCDMNRSVASMAKAEVLEELAAALGSGDHPTMDGG